MFRAIRPDSKPAAARKGKKRGAGSDPALGDVGWFNRNLDAERKNGGRISARKRAGRHGRNLSVYDQAAEASACTGVARKPSQKRNSGCIPSGIS